MFLLPSKGGFYHNVIKDSVGLAVLKAMSRSFQAKYM
jgi:hypothetical protein